MAKRDDLKRSIGGNVTESMGAARPSMLPAGLDPGSAVRKPRELEGVSKEKAAARIAIDRIVPDENQPREEFDEDALRRLSESLRTRGQLQPIRVRWDQGRGVYVILVGERRWRAAKLAGMIELSCTIDEGELSAEERLEVQLVENALREDLRPVEQAKAYRALMKVKGWSGNQLSKELHIGQASVVRALSLLDLPSAVQARVEQGELAPSSAAEIAQLPDHKTQAAVAEAVVAGGLKRDEVTALVRAVKSQRPVPKTRPDPVTHDLGDCTVTVRWRRPAEISAVEALTLALKRERERADEQAA